MKPTKKNPQIDEFLTLLGSNRKEAITSNLCIKPPIGCGKPITPFKDDISEKEYTISGLCQQCQDNFYGE